MRSTADRKSPSRHGNLAVLDFTDSNVTTASPQIAQCRCIPTISSFDQYGNPSEAFSPSKTVKGVLPMQGAHAFEVHGRTVTECNGLGLHH